jgi:hypothetical protein
VGKCGEGGVGVGSSRLVGTWHAGPSPQVEELEDGAHGEERAEADQDVVVLQSGG